jgi:hypothetical protein
VTGTQKEPHSLLPNGRNSHPPLPGWLSLELVKPPLLPNQFNLFTGAQKSVRLPQHCSGVPEHTPSQNGLHAVVGI